MKYVKIDEETGSVSWEESGADRKSPIRGRSSLQGLGRGGINRSVSFFTTV